MSLPDPLEPAWAKAAGDIERDGYGRVPGVLGHGDVSRALDLVRRHARDADATLLHNPPSMGGGAVVWNLQNKDAFFLDLLFAEPMLERLLMHFLNDPWYGAMPADEPNYILRAYVARAGLAALPLHIDSFIPYVGTMPLSIQAVFVLEEMRIGRGATRMVAGSHQSGTWAEQSAMAGARSIEADPGDLLLWDSRVWHGAEDNPSGVSRWTLIATFTRWWIKQAFRVTEALPQDIWEGRSLRERAVLGYCSEPFLDESEGIRTQKGLEAAARRRGRAE